MAMHKKCIKISIFSHQIYNIFASFAFLDHMGLRILIVDEKRDVI